METILPGSLQDQVLKEDAIITLDDICFNKTINVPPRSRPEHSTGSSTASSNAGSGTSSIHSERMAIDDLEYHITFPGPNNCHPLHIGQKVSVSNISHYHVHKKTANGNNNGNAGDDKKNDLMVKTDADNGNVTKETAAVQGQKVPVVVLLGWYGCQDKHLSKYSKIYEDLGCITIRLLPKANIIIYQPDSLRSIASKLFEVVEDYNLEDNNVILHIFSNGGCYVYRQICLLQSPKSSKKSSKLDNSPQEASVDNNSNQSTTTSTTNSSENILKIQGCIFDSCPAVTSPLHLFRAIAAATTSGNIVYRWVRSLVLMFAVIFAAVMEFLLGFVWSESKRVSPQAMWNALAKDPSRCPQLFLYSKADEICHYKSIKSFAEERRKCGVDVNEICWEDSPHVKHFIMHRTEYIDQILGFVAKCLNPDATLSLIPEAPETKITIDDTAAECEKTYVDDNRPDTP